MTRLRPVALVGHCLALDPIYYCQKIEPRDMFESKRPADEAALKEKAHSINLESGTNDLEISRNAIEKSFDRCISDFLSSKSRSFVVLKLVTAIMAVLTFLALARGGLSIPFFAYASSTCFLGYFLLEASEQRKAFRQRVLSIKRSVNSIIDSVGSREPAGLAAEGSIQAAIDSTDKSKPQDNDEHNVSNTYDSLMKMTPKEPISDLLGKDVRGRADASMSMSETGLSSPKSTTKQSYTCSVGKEGEIIIDDSYIRILDLIPGDRFAVEVIPDIILLRPVEDKDLPSHISDEQALTVDDSYRLVIPGPLAARSGACTGDGFRIALGPSFLRLERLLIHSELAFVNRFCRLLEEGRHLVSLLYINERLRACEIYVGRHQCCLFIDNLLISDRMLPGFLYLNMDGIYSNCFDSSDFTCIFSWDVLTDVVPNKDDYSSIDLVCAEGRLTISEPEGRDGDSRLKLLAAFYYGIWQQIKKVAGDQDVIIWNDVYRLGVKEHGVESECDLLDLVSQLGY